MDKNSHMGIDLIKFVSMHSRIHKTIHSWTHDYIRSSDQSNRRYLCESLHLFNLCHRKSAPKLLPIFVNYFGDLWQGGVRKHVGISCNTMPIVHWIHFAQTSIDIITKWIFIKWIRLNDIHTILLRRTQNELSASTNDSRCENCTCENHLTLVHLKEMDKQRLQLDTRDVTYTHISRQCHHFCANV